MRNPIIRCWTAGLCTAVFVLIICAVFSYAAGSDSARLRAVRIGKHTNFERLVLDIDGVHPSRIGPPSADSFVLEFRKLESALQLDQLSFRSVSAVGGMELQHEGRGFRLIIRLQQPKTSVRHFYLPSDPPRAGCYRLVLDFSAPSLTASSSTVVEIPPAAGKHDLAQENDRSSGSRSAAGENRSPFSMPEVVSPDAPVADLVQQVTSGDEKIDVLFRSADNAFTAHQDNLAEDAYSILELYRKAIKTAPGAPQVPLALCRCALIYLALGDFKKTTVLAQQVISDYPDHPCVPLCWMAMGQAHEQNKSYVEAVECFRTALGFPLPKTEKARAYHLLGKSFSRANAHQEAVDIFEKSLAEDPDYYLKQTDLLKFLGESSFALQKYDQSLDCLLRYLNIQKEVPDRDLILARIAEILRHLGHESLGARIYAYIRKNLPDSEGYVITKIREAELIEDQNPQQSDKAVAIYDELAKKSLSPQLRKLVIFKLAFWKWRKGDLQGSLDLIDGVLKDTDGSKNTDEYQALREKVIIDLAKKAFAESDYVRVTQLYHDHKPLFRSQASPETLAAVAESYGNLRAYPNAADLYQTILNQSSKKNEEWLYNAAHYCFLMGNPDKAFQLCTQVKAESLEAQKTELLGQIYFARKQHKELVELLDGYTRKGKKPQPLPLVSLVQYAESLMALGRHQDALGCLEKASAVVTKEDIDKTVQVCLLQSKCHLNLKQNQEAIEVLERALPMVQSEGLKDQLNYQLSDLYIETKQFQQANAKLNELLQSSETLWKTAAQQQLDYLQMQGALSKAASF